MAMGSVDGTGEKGNVELVCQKSSDMILDIAFQYFLLHASARLAKPLQYFGKAPISQRRPQADPDRIARCCCYQFRCASDLVQAAPDVLDKYLPLVGKADAGMAANKKRRSKPDFEIADMAADSRLFDVERGRGFTEAPVFRGRNQISQLPKIHMAHRIVIPIIVPAGGPQKRAFRNGATPLLRVPLSPRATGGGTDAATVQGD